MCSVQTFKFTFDLEWLLNFRFLLIFKSDLEPRPFGRVTSRVHFNAELIDIRFAAPGFSQRLPIHRNRRKVYMVTLDIIRRKTSEIKNPCTFCALCIN